MHGNIKIMTSDFTSNTKTHAQTHCIVLLTCTNPESASSCLSYTPDLHLTKELIFAQGFCVWRGEGGKRGDMTGSRTRRVDCCFIWCNIFSWELSCDGRLTQLVLQEPRECCLLRRGKKTDWRSLLYLNIDWFITFFYLLRWALFAVSSLYYFILFFCFVIIPFCSVFCTFFV